MSTLPLTPDEWRAAVHPIPLELNEDDIKASLSIKSPCPFCGKKNPGIRGQINESTGIIGYHIFCDPVHCGCSVHSNARDRDKARSNAINQWEDRRSIHERWK